MVLGVASERRLVPVGWRRRWSQDWFQCRCWGWICERVDGSVVLAYEVVAIGELLECEPRVVLASVRSPVNLVDVPFASCVGLSVDDALYELVVRIDRVVAVVGERRIRHKAFDIYLIEKPARMKVS
jgi:hypothetical protein